MGKCNNSFFVRINELDIAGIEEGLKNDIERAEKCIARFEILKSIVMNIAMGHGIMHVQIVWLVLSRI